jgi:hypothetical protein
MRQKGSADLRLGQGGDHGRSLTHFKEPVGQLRIGAAPVQIRMTQIKVTQRTGDADGGHVEMAGQLGDGVSFQIGQGAADLLALGLEPSSQCFSGARNTSS